MKISIKMRSLITAQINVDLKHNKLSCQYDNNTNVSADYITPWCKPKKQL